MNNCIDGKGVLIYICNTEAQTQKRSAIVYCYLHYLTLNKAYVITLPAGLWDTAVVSGFSVNP